MADFIPFAEAVHAKYLTMADSRHFTTSITKDELKAVYIGAFPEGTDPIYIDEDYTAHTCSCCFNFIKNMGSIVIIEDGKLTSVWDVEGLEFPYDVVAKAMHEAVTATPITGTYYTSERKYGAKQTTQMLHDGKHINWNHFYGQVGSDYFVKNPNEKMGFLDDKAGVFKRALTEITIESLDTILELIADDNLARGPEFKQAVVKFAAAKGLVADVTPEQLTLFTWENCDSPVASFRNTAIGTLAVDLSEGVEIDIAISKFKKVVSGENYKRPKPIITQRQRDALIKQIDDSGLRPALPRRHATFGDMSANDVLWVDQETNVQMTDPLADLLDVGVKASTKIPTMEGAQEVSHGFFAASVLPKAVKLQLLLENQHLNHFMSMTAPINADAPKLFHWNNNMAWAYDGDVAESVLTKRIREAGGRVDGDFRFSHSWNHEGQENQSLMDLHVFLPSAKAKLNTNKQQGNPRSGIDRIGWDARRNQSVDGSQDVDYTSAAPKGYIPVENISIPSLSKMPDGDYVCKVHNWSLRGITKGGGKAELQLGADVYQYDYPRLGNFEWCDVATVTVKDHAFVDVKHHLPLASGSTVSAEKWGLTTGELVDVATVVHSPNHWEGAGEKGNKHTFYILKKCSNPDKVRGIFNEFLDSKHNEFRKGFEVLGSASKCEFATEQMSGVGYSHTQRGEMNFIVTEASGKTVAYKVTH